MADFTIEAKRIKTGDALTSMNTQAMNAINQLKQIKLNIASMREEVAGSKDYISDDVAAIDAINTTLLTEIANI